MAVVFAIQIDSIEADADLLDAIADDARLIMNRDPDLTSERGQAVQVLEELFDWKNHKAGAS